MSFDSDMALWATDIKQKTFEGVKLVAGEIFVDLCEHSPVPGSAPFSVGSYVLSHRINGGTADTSTTEITNENYGAMGEAMSNQLPKINSISQFQDIVISNSIYYNENVESIGWSSSGPYQTFHKTEGPMDAKAQQIMDRI